MPRARIGPETAIVLSGLLLPVVAVSVAAPTVHASPPPASETSAPVSGVPAITITLQSGDTLWGLAQTYGVPVPVLQAANGLGSRTLIYAGSPFVIPGRTVVTPGSSLSQIAAGFGVEVGPLMDMNGLSSPTLSVGQTLYVPAAANPAATVTDLSSSVVSDLAHLVQAEAGNQPFLGQVAVAAVVLNRLKAPGFPKTVAGVIFQPGQFDSVANGTYWMAPSNEAYQAAVAAISGEDPTDGALYYYNPSLTQNPWMKDLPILVTIGSQVFCK